MKRLIAVALALLLAAAWQAAAEAGVIGAAEDGGAIRVAVQPVPLDPQNPARPGVGDFAYAGGLWLKPSAGLGGLSDLKIDGQGGLIAEFDEGSLLRAHVVLDRKGWLTGLDRATLEPLKGEDGRPLSSKRDADAEGVALWPGGELMVSFERRHRIWIYDRNQRPRTLPMPAAAMPDNAGMEGLATAPSRGPDAYWVGIEGGSIWLCRPSTGCSRWTGLMAPPRGFRLTSLTETPAGDLVLLHHSFNPITGQSRALATIVTIPNRPAGPSQVKAQLRLDPPMNVDNFEGVAATQGPTGGLRLYLISDDNFSDKQRTLLMAFDWAAPSLKAKGGPRR